MKKLFQTFYNSEIFIHNLQLRNSRVLWFAVGSYLTYDYFTTYLKYSEIKKSTFERNFQSIHDKYQKSHFQASHSTIDVQGFPDEGDWLFSKVIPEEELGLILRHKNRFDERLKEFCVIMPLFVIGGLWTPVLTAALGGGLAFLNSKIDKKNEELKDTKKLENTKEYVLYALIANSFGSCIALRFL